MNTQRETAKRIERVFDSFAEEIEMERAKANYTPKDSYIVDDQIVDLTDEEVLALRRSGKTVKNYY